jgi:hypothetical protein
MGKNNGYLVIYTSHSKLTKHTTVDILFICPLFQHSFRNKLCILSQEEEKKKENLHKFQKNQTRIFAVKTPSLL